ncbi:MAG: glycosyltransferase family 39 protein [Bryobacterales bacterium]|nr:glycosyltransferase family 39 protein [Bryobacterales bacterium]
MARQSGTAGRAAWILLIIFAAYWLYLFGLTAVGLLGPDEPRYASIGRAMALTGDWVTPRLWGVPWFEKPVLLYWLTGWSFRAGLSPDLAPRLPIAIVSVAFLAFYGWRLKREFGAAPAALATTILAASAGWLGFSFVAVTDLPLAAAFSAALLVGLDWLRSGGRKMAFAAGALLGVAVLAKGLVPLALSIPLFWFARKRWRQWWLPALGVLVTAGPWYLLCALDNGRVFLVEFILKHHFGRFFSNALQHGQPAWFYIPVLAGGLFPWTPAALLLFSRRIFADEQRRVLAWTVLFGFVLFSAGENKLPGYLLPLFPALAALIALRVVESRRRAVWLAGCVVLLGLAPVAVRILPAALANGIRRSSFPPALALWLIPSILVAAAVLWLSRRRAWWVPAAVVAAGTTVGVVYVKTAVAPLLDNTSIRPLARRISTEAPQVCVGALHRSLRYGLNYYTVQPLPDCAVDPRPLRIEQTPGHAPQLVVSPSSSSGPRPAPAGSSS